MSCLCHLWFFKVIAFGLFQAVYVGHLGILAEIIRDLKYLLGGIGPARVEAGQGQVTLFKVKDCLCRFSHYPV
jgi:hypothetical protein